MSFSGTAYVLPIFDNWDTFIAVYTSTGAFQVARRYFGTGAQFSGGFDIWRPGGDFFLAGEFQFSMTLNALTLTALSNGYMGFTAYVAKMNSAGNSTAWALRWGSPAGSVSAVGVTTDGTCT